MNKKKINRKVNNKKNNSNNRCTSYQVLKATNLFYILFSVKTSPAILTSDIRNERLIHPHLYTYHIYM